MWVHIDDDEVLSVIRALRAGGEMKLADEIEDWIAGNQRDGAIIDRYRARARAHYAAQGELEFDDDAVVSLGDGAGAYVMGWQWVAQP